MNSIPVINQYLGSCLTWNRLAWKAGEMAAVSVPAMGARALMLHQQFAAFAFRQAISASETMMSMGAGRTLAESAVGQSKPARDLTTGTVAAASKSSRGAARIVRSTSKPVHKRVGKHARRPRKR